jgi:hypothetical protein
MASRKPFVYFGAFIGIGFGASMLGPSLDQLRDHLGGISRERIGVLVTS